MTRRRDRHRNLLHWFPSAWRVRYGEELVALMEDTYGGERIPLREQVSIARVGLTRRLLGSGAGAPPDEKVSSGSLLVLAGWACLVVAGCGYAKFAEHWEGAVPAHDLALPTAGFDAVQTAATVGAIVVALATLLAVPSFLRLLRAGGWPAVRRPVVRAIVATAVAISSTAVVIAWSHHVGVAVHPGGWRVGVIGTFWILSMLSALACGTAAVFAVVPRLTLPRGVLVAVGALALVLGLAMVAVVTGTVLWWVALATDTPSFFAGRSGLFDTPAPPTVVGGGLVMAAGLALGMYGSVRVVRSMRRLLVD